ncbi:unnamed protein product [Adineta steineri]|uniref:Uncharacterized protein n=1 Tax=Adineta steineri TaxID=433720 RepID=A0A819LFF9_9BILA|nr:unnamed protein product [Adineta steineri]CAF3960960.1 unnamed protein product [Adineta steineri]
MQRFSFVLIFVLVLITEAKATVNDNNDELSWTTTMGNARNTRRLIPSLATEFNGSTWTTIFNSSSQDATVFGAGAGINGDLYLFVTDSRYGSADYMLCLTTNGDIRWKMYLESPPRMMNTAVSNIVSDQVNNLLYYTSTWADTGSFVSKICRVFYPQTHHPAQECVNTYKISSNFLAPLALSTKADLLITSVITNAPAAFNTTTFEMLWSDSETMGSDPSADYKADPFTGDIYWIGGDDVMGKMNSNGTRLFINDTNSGGNRDFALDSRRQIVVRAWQNMSDHDWPLIVSAWDVENTGLHERWQWKDDNNNTMNTDCTPPMMDVQNGITYFVNLPYAIALDTNTGSRRWQTEVVTKSDMDNLDLAAECTAFNEQSRVVYVFVKSTKAPFKLMLIAVHADTGKILRQMDVARTDSKIVKSFCPMLIGNEMIYISWLTGAYPDLVPLTITGVPQLS